jgi:ribonuclease P protein component
VQVTVSVSKKNFKRAVDRNLLRRRTREAFRLHKTNIYTKIEDNQRFAWLIMFTAKEILEYKDIERGMKKLFRRFEEARNQPV